MVNDCSAGLKNWPHRIKAPPPQRKYDETRQAATKPTRSELCFSLELIKGMVLYA